MRRLGLTKTVGQINNLLVVSTGNQARVVEYYNIFHVQIFAGTGFKCIYGKTRYCPLEPHIRSENILYIFVIILRAYKRIIVQVSKVRE